MPATCQVLSGHFTCTGILPATAQRCCLLGADEEPEAWWSPEMAGALEELGPEPRSAGSGPLVPGGSGPLAVLLGPCP